MPKPADKFTRYKQIAAGKRFNLQSPILAAYQASQTTTMGVVVEVIEMAADQLDRCVVSFRGKLLRATCCHPDITVGLSVAMIEQPIGVWWATVLQKSWYSRPLAELIEKGHKYQAALEYLLSFGPKWRPTLIIIDKRGEVQPEPPEPPEVWPPEVWPPVDQPFPWDTTGLVPTMPTDPQTGLPYQFSDLDRNGDGKLSPEEWPFDPYLFEFADANKDGFVSLAEWLAFMAYWETKTPLPALPNRLSVYTWSISMHVPNPAYYAAVLVAAAACGATIAEKNAEAPIVFYLSGGVRRWRRVEYSLYQFGPASYGTLGILTYVWGACIFTGTYEDYWPWSG